MSVHDFNYDGETPSNYQQKCPVVLILDKSGSMQGPAIDELNKGLQLFKSEILKNSTAAARIDLAVVSFNDQITIEHDFGLINDEYHMPILQASGSTAMVDAIRTGVKLIGGRKNYYKKSGQTYYRSNLILITDGHPDEEQDVEGLAAELKKDVSDKRFNFWPIAVQKADLTILDKWAQPQIKGSLPTMKLDGLKFAELFLWLSTSMTKISTSRPGDDIDITPTKANNPFIFKVD